ncbi:S8 family serine peptidase [Belliella marina]|uniref:S8 family serine peptidase n=1 Tax=Belliella marina TaxID=1644146 RepID=A0ABW4VLW9_9BACT
MVIVKYRSEWWYSRCGYKNMSRVGDFYRMRRYNCCSARSGMEPHEDLNNILPLNFNTEFGIPPFGDHGMLVSGILGAERNNSIGIAGVSYDSPLMDIANSLLSVPASRIARADGINWAWENQASVINNSWGSSVIYDVIDEAIENAVINGRNGLGSIVVFAT